MEGGSWLENALMTYRPGEATGGFVGKVYPILKKFMLSISSCHASSTINETSLQKVTDTNQFDSSTSGRERFLHCYTTCS